MRHMKVDKKRPRQKHFKGGPNSKPVAPKKKIQYFSFPRIKYLKLACKFFAKIFGRMETQRLFGGWKAVEVVFQVTAVRVRKFRSKLRGKVLRKCFDVLRNPKYHVKKGEMKKYTRPTGDARSRK